MVRIQVVLDPTEAKVLERLARSELRDPRDQLRHILREELARRGLLFVGADSKQKAGMEGQEAHGVQV